MQIKQMLMKQISIKMIPMTFQVKAKVQVKEIKMNSKLSEVVMNLLDLLRMMVKSTIRMASLNQRKT